jgi:hypothetical protein
MFARRSINKIRVAETSRNDIHQRHVDDLQQLPHATADGNPHCLLEFLHPLVKGTEVLGATHLYASVGVKNHSFQQWCFKQETLNNIISTSISSSTMLLKLADSTSLGKKGYL